VIRKGPRTLENSCDTGAGICARTTQQARARRRRFEAGIAHEQRAGGKHGGATKRQRGGALGECEGGNELQGGLILQCVHGELPGMEMGPP